MPTFVLPTVFFFVTALLALLAIDPNTLAPRLAAYGSMGATALSYLLWPLIVSLAVVVAWLGSRWARAAGRKLREAMDQNVAKIVDVRLEQHRRDLAKQDFETLVEKIVRSPDQLATLANHLGIGAKPTSANGLGFRVAKLELVIAGHTNVLSDMEKIAERIDLINTDVNSLSEWTKDQLQRRDIMGVLDDHWPTIRDHAQVVATYFDNRQSEYDWPTWFSLRDKWEAEFEGWAAVFPNLVPFDAVRDVFKVSAAEVADCYSRHAKPVRFGTDQQMNAYYTFLAVFTRFQHDAPEAMKRMQALASADAK